MRRPALVPVLAALLVGSALAGAAALAAEAWLRPTQGPAPQVIISPDPAACTNHLPATATPQGNGTLFTFVAAERGPWRLADLTYHLRGPEPPPEGEPQEPAPPPGTLAEAAAAPEDAPVRYLDQTDPADQVNPGDALLVQLPGGFHLELHDARGALVGGTWGCI